MVVLKSINFVFRPFFFFLNWTVKKTETKKHIPLDISINGKVSTLYKHHEDPDLVCSVYELH